MEKIEQNEQWKLNGDCNLCRRKNYCKKPCTKYTRATNRMIYSMVHQIMDKATYGAYSEIINRAEEACERIRER